MAVDKALGRAEIGLRVRPGLRQHTCGTYQREVANVPPIHRERPRVRSRTSPGYVRKVVKGRMKTYPCYVRHVLKDVAARMTTYLRTS
jgi:hypothetical protein